VPRLISFPFALDATGSIASVEQDSDAEVEQQLAVAMLTRPGERITVPTFGTADPSFAGFGIAAVQRHCLDFGPDVVVTAAETRLLDGDREYVTLQWARAGVTEGDQ
jgi:hypothetical protein